MPNSNGRYESDKLHVDQSMDLRVAAYKLGFDDGIREGRNEIRAKVRAWIEEDQMDWERLKGMLVEEAAEEEPR